MSRTSENPSTDTNSGSSPLVASSSQQEGNVSRTRSGSVQSARFVLPVSARHDDTSFLAEQRVVQEADHAPLELGRLCVDAAGV